MPAIISRLDAAVYKANGTESFIANDKYPEIHTNRVLRSGLVNWSFYYSAPELAVFRVEVTARM